MITMDNYEGWLMRYADGDLDADGCKEVEAFLVKHPALREEMEAVSDVKVAPPVAVMPDKERLLQREVPVWPRAVAAAIGLLLVTGVALSLLPTIEVPAFLTAEVPIMAPAIAIPAMDSLPIQAVPTIHRRVVPVAEVVYTEEVPTEEPAVTETVTPPIAELEVNNPKSVVPIVIETDQLAVVAPSTTITEGYIIDVQLTTTPMQTLVRGLLALKEE